MTDARRRTSYRASLGIRPEVDATAAASRVAAWDWLTLLTHEEAAWLQARGDAPSADASRVSFIGE